jgi:hypothetical protein
MENPRVRIEPGRDRSTHGSELLNQPRRDPGGSPASGAGSGGRYSTHRFSPQRDIIFRLSARALTAA